jgi:hypothetical protein
LNPVKMRISCDETIERTSRLFVELWNDVYVRKSRNKLAVEGADKRLLPFENSMNRLRDGLVGVTAHVLRETTGIDFADFCPLVRSRSVC